MSIKFTDLQGKASKLGPERFKPKEGENRIRIVGSVIPCYKYWLKSKDNASVPMDCLGFNPETEQFDNAEKDVVREHFPDIRCSWAYQSYVIDREDNKLKLFDHKKKLFEAILNAAKKKLGDPSDPDNGWDIVFSKTKTGPRAFNVEYRLETFDLKNTPLSDEDKELIAAEKPIEEIVKRPTAEDQEKFIKNYILGDSNSPDEDVEDELTSDDTSEDDLK